eukprot:TRINITY_DN33279_c0_g5_i1.p1 TRINITY_DN33279_c0_g5~~TRINITY_DN33279_c0_g5_i1.p1  ORF type:complete len:114 (-),score=21.77 TRINITY_DN33279_c0_g5_i1:391-732(-)
MGMVHTPDTPFVPNPYDYLVGSLSLKALPDRSVNGDPTMAIEFISTDTKAGDIFTFLLNLTDGICKVTKNSDAEEKDIAVFKNVEAPIYPAVILCGLGKTKQEVELTAFKYLD